MFFFVYLEKEKKLYSTKWHKMCFFQKYLYLSPKGFLLEALHSNGNFSLVSYFPLKIVLLKLPLEISIYFLGMGMDIFWNGITNNYAIHSDHEEDVFIAFIKVIPNEGKSECCYPRDASSIPSPTNAIHSDRDIGFGTS